MEESIVYKQGNFERVLVKIDEKNDVYKFLINLSKKNLEGYRIFDIIYKTEKIVDKSKNNVKILSDSICGQQVLLKRNQ